jgi:hypothetical protein
MAGVLHESLILLLSRAPQLVVELFGAALGLEPDAEVVPCDPVTHEPVTMERRADCVFRARARDGPRAVVVEVQLRRDSRKTQVWPYYAAGERLRQRCPAAVAVLAPKPAVAAWAARPIATGQPGCDFKALVVDERGVPRVTEPDPARPERVVMSAIVHGNEPGGERVVAAAAATLRRMVDEERRAEYYWILWACLGEAMRRRLEELMDIWAVLAKTPTGRELIAKGKAIGEARGRRQGRAEGRAAGLAAGLLEGKTAALLAIFAARRLRLTAGQRARVLACDDRECLERWIAQAITAPTVAAALR